MTMNNSDRRTGHAVVIGASMGGLLAARVLSDTFATVTVFDRDQLPTDSTERRGVPQGFHAHGLLARGREILDELFPGMVEEMAEAGAVPIDIQHDVRWYHEARLLHRAPSDLRGLCVSRLHLEGALRARVAELPNVTLVPEVEVIGLLADAASTPASRVTGVRVYHHRTGTAGTTGLSGTTGAEQEIPADLVVDVSGRGNRGATWLAALGYPAAPEERVEAKVVYASREYRRHPGDLDVAATVIGATLDAPRGGVALSGEGDRWLVTLFGMADDLPPTDPAGFTDYAATLPVPIIHDLITRVEPLTEVRRMRIPTSIRRRYERMARFPDGLVIMGDALCQFNPSYGQGMTVAASEAIVLRDCLRQGRAGLPRRFFRAAARVVDVPWDVAVGADLRFDHVEGRRTARVNMINSYVARLQVAAERDSVLAYSFLRVANLMAGPQRLFAPGVLRRVLFRRSRIQENASEYAAPRPTVAP